MIANGPRRRRSRGLAGRGETERAGAGAKSGFCIGLVESFAYSRVQPHHLPGILCIPDEEPAYSEQKTAAKPGLQLRVKAACKVLAASDAKRTENPHSWNRHGCKDVGETRRAIDPPARSSASLDDMDTILCSISALAYLRTPPQIRGGALATTSLSADSPLAGLRLRANAPQDLRRAVPELLGPLKGAGLPLHFAGTASHRGAGPLGIWHAGKAPYRAEDLCPIGDALWVTSPLRTLAEIGRRTTFARLLMLAYEFCGLYAICPQNERVALAVDALLAEGVLARGATQLSAYYGWDGEPLDFDGPRERPWGPCLDISGATTPLWKRAPLITPAELRRYAAERRDVSGRRLMRVAELVNPGSASPLETLASLLLGPSRRLGMEGLPVPKLNRRIRLGGGGALVPDLSWEEGHGSPLPFVVELDGAAHHGHAVGAGAGGVPLRDAQRRTELQAAGFTVLTVTFPQLANFDRWSSVVEVIAAHLGVDATPPTPTFLRQQARLRRELFSADCDGSAHVGP